jgi:peroxiredoxin
MPTSTHLFPAGSSIPSMTFETVGGDPVTVGGVKDRWTLLVVYRGKHCGRCKPYLNKLQGMKAAWEDAGFDIVTVSADPIEKARADVEEYGWSFPVGYGLTEDQMRSLGLYISSPLSASETDRNFAEPGHYCIRPDGTALLIAVSNGPSARPDLDQLLDGMIFTIENDRPARGII